ncbi:MAG TPA: ATP-binding cassette domain-containing protein [Planctomycetaceae bacterium]|jgi:osmoprotectant transport system ATP-binding protein|nr:ATP-binding cassette domain-containing protein [Planctomycetaceae bacterium]
MLEFRGVSKAFNGATVVQPFDLIIEQGEVVVLLGPSGCGKTTILRMVAGLSAPSGGQILVDATLLSDQTLSAVRRKLGYVIQEGGLFPHLTALENVTLMPRHDGWSRTKIDARLSTLVQMTQFPSSALTRYPNELSGGQRQRLSLMRALFLNPRILLLDEPLGALDPLIRAGLQRDLNDVFERIGTTVLLVTHDLVEAGRFADRVCVMNAGRIVQQGPFAEILENPSDDFVREFVSSQVVSS